ncbi:streptophobe family protein [Streptomyces sp. NPDC060188]|uniref:streptophobe family protein n=1 Tax=Streptomyces sp. NPDC060188 TaxID=3347068 RepID=UPI003653B704
MSATTSRTRTHPQGGSAPGPRPGARPRSRRPPVPVRYISPGWNALEGAAAVLYAVVAMAVVSAGALGLLHAGSVGSLWSLTALVTAMAVGGSVTGGSSMSGGTGTSGGLDSLLGGAGGGMGPSLSATADGVPLTVALVGAVVRWIAFPRRLRRADRVRFTPGELAVRAAGAGVAAFALFLIMAGLAHGTVVADTSRTRTTGGAGLGLAIVQSLVTAHEGQVEVDSAPSKGTTFRVLLPRLTVV